MLSLPLLLSLAVPGPPVPFSEPMWFGPQWISIELPANPYDQTTRGAFLMVHAFHHGTPMGYPVTGRAEGLVDGARRTVPLKFERTDRPGVFALTNQWGDAGEWTLMITLSQGQNGGATALVQVSGGEVFSVRVPTERRGGMVVPRAVTLAEVEATLKDRPTRVAANR